MLLIAIQQSNTCVDVINILVNRKVSDFIIKSNDIMGKNMLCLYLDSENHSLDIVNGEMIKRTENSCNFLVVHIVNIG